ncbi:MAG: DeoR family transcriptional regulator, partial [Planctomycetes bacterium]|nr:DeoR family transcriptional regulator [Planctomycetota bacterium]
MNGLPELAEPRQPAIAAILHDGGEALVSDLARRFGGSEMPIRRDLRTLE